jgi:Leucine-rich repeat (LRR) protein
VLTEIHADRFPNLETLEIRGNKLTTTKGINLPKLKQLYIAANQLAKIEDFNNLPVLNTLHIRDNKLENLDGFSENLKSLQYVNFRGNLINDYVQVKKLQQLVKLRALVLAGMFDGGRCCLFFFIYFVLSFFFRNTAC